MTTFVLINGAFGIGKSTVARELRRILPGAAIFDPEWLGFVLMKLPGYRESDYQHLRIWRAITVLVGRGVGRFCGVVLVPMCFSEPSYLEEVRLGYARGGHTVLHFCLTAPIEIIRERLAARGESADNPNCAWVHRRSAECCAVHGSASFGIQIATEARPPMEIARDIFNQIRYLSCATT